MSTECSSSASELSFGEKSLESRGDAEGDADLWDADVLRESRGGIDFRLMTIMLFHEERERRIGRSFGLSSLLGSGHRPCCDERRLNASLDGFGGVIDCLKGDEWSGHVRQRRGVVRAR
jgi:hypothetical protein